VAKLLSIDPGVHSTHWALFADGVLVSYGTEDDSDHPCPDPVGLYSRLKLNPDEGDRVLIEGQFPGPHHAVDLAAARGHLFGVAYHCGLRPVLAQPQGEKRWPKVWAPKAARPWCLAWCAERGEPLFPKRWLISAGAKSANLANNQLTAIALGRWWIEFR
jgi:hypothetical protein